MAELVDVGNYHDAVPAELARARLTSNGIQAFVVDSAAFNPLLNDAVGGVRLKVYEEDEARARELLDETLDEQDDDEDVVRCPRWSSSIVSTSARACTRHLPQQQATSSWWSPRCSSGSRGSGGPVTNAATSGTMPKKGRSG